MDNTTNQSFDKAFSLLYGKELAIDPSIGMGYLAQFIHALETGTMAFEKTKGIELITTAGVITTADLKENIDNRVEAVPKGSVVKLYLNDYMSVNGGLCSLGVKDLADNLLSFKSNPNVSGAIIEVNSGGGEAMAGQIMFNAIKDFKKPVVALVHNAGSAAYLAIAGVKEIIASGNLSRVGSIGAFVSLDRKFIAQYKERFQDIYADGSGDKNAAIRSFIETGDTELIRASLNETVQAFQEIVLNHRPIKKQEETLRGAMFPALDSKKRGLVDAIGTEDFALKRLKVYTN